MIEKDMEIRLRKCLKHSSVSVRDSALKQTVLLAKHEIQSKKKKQRIGFGKFLLLQIKLSGWKIWLIQLCLTIGMTGFLQGFYRNLYIMTPRRIAIILCLVAFLISFTVIPSIYRSFYYKMTEIEAVTRNSSIKLVLSQLLMIGVGDGVMIGIVTMLTVVKTNFSTGRTLFYMLVPLLIIWFSVIVLLRYIGIKKFPYYGFMLYCFLFVLMMLFNRCYTKWYEQTFSAQWIVICGALFLSCIYQLQNLLKQSVDMVCE